MGNKQELPPKHVVFHKSVSTGSNCFNTPVHSETNLILPTYNAKYDNNLELHSMDIDDDYKQTSNVHILIAGYVRPLTPSNINCSTISIIGLCTKYYIICFQWLPSLSNSMKFLSSTHIQLSSTQWEIAVGKHSINDQICNEYSFEIKCHSSINKTGRAFMMGFINEKYIHSSEMQWNAHLNVDGDNQFAVYVGNGKQVFEVYGRRKIAEFEANERLHMNYGFSKGDVFRLEFNLKAKHILLFYNRSLISAVFENMELLNCNFVPAIALCNCEINVIGCNYK